MIWNNSYRERHYIISVSFDESGATEPLTLVEVKAYLKIETVDDDVILEIMRVACRKELEQYLGLSLVEKEITLEGDIGYEWELPYGPVVSIDTVTRRTGTATDGTAEYDTLDPDHYTVQGNLFSPGYGRYVVVYTAGFASAAVVPSDIKIQLLRLIAYRYEHRGDSEQSSISKIVGISNKNFSWI